MASLQFAHQGGTTIHHWAGLMDGRHSSQELARLLLQDDRYLESRTRIQKADTLIIDEISMLSKVRLILYTFFVCKQKYLGQVRI
jgi:hypothetical protein